ncbi:MAG: hypothetical protein R3E95_21285 [Thiolinea sp.]
MMKPKKLAIVNFWWCSEINNFLYFLKNFMFNFFLRPLSQKLYAPIELEKLVHTESDSSCCNEEQRQQSWLLVAGFKAGYYMLECSLVMTNPGLLKIGSDDHSVEFCLQINSPHLKKRIFWLDDSVNSMAIKLVGEVDDCLAIRYLRLVPLRRSFATRRMLYRLRMTPQQLREKSSQSGLDEQTWLRRAYELIFLADQDKAYQYWQDQVEPDLLQDLPVPLQSRRGSAFCLVLSSRLQTGSCGSSTHAASLESESGSHSGVH